MRLVLEEVFRPATEKELDEGVDIDGRIKMGEVVIYTRQLDAQQMIKCKTWSKKYKDKLKEHGIDVE